MKTRLCPPPAGALPARHPRALLKKASVLSATLLLALASIAQADPPTVTQLQPQVDALPNTTTQQKLMRAMLEWALGESTREANATYSNNLSWPAAYPYESNHAQIALDLRSDVNDILHPSGSNTPTQIGSPKGGSRTDLFPTIPHYNSGDRTNPIANEVDSRVGGILSSNGPITASGEQDLYVMQAFCSPASIHYSDPALIPILLNFLNFTWDTLGYTVNQTTLQIDETSVTTDHVGVDDTFSHEYLLLTTQFPDLILPRCRQRWEAGNYRVSNLFYSDDGPNINSGDTARIYPNIQSRHMGNMFYTSQFLLGPYSTYNTSGFPYYGPTPSGAPSTNATPAQLKATAYAYIHIATDPAVQFPDGGFTYFQGFGTVGLYFGAEIQNIGYIRQIIRGYTASDDMAAAADATTILQRARLYLPLDYPHKGFFFDQGPVYPYFKSTFDQDPAWAAVFSLDPDLSSARDPQLWRFVTENEVSGVYANGEVTLSLAASYNVDLEPTIPPDPDNYFIYDQNLEGPQGIFGNWQMLGTCRVDTNDNRGEESSVTCVGLWTTGSALWTATTSAGDDRGTYGSVTARDKIASTVVQPTFASLALTHAMWIRDTQHVFDNRPWSESQEWVYTPHRMIGFLNVRKVAPIPATTSEDPTPEVEAGIGFISRADNHTSAGYTQKSSSTNVGEDFTFGTLVTHLVSSNYNGVTNSGASPANFYVVNDGTATEEGPTLVVSDAGPTASHSSVKNYTVGTTGYILVDYHPTSENDATGIVTLPVATGLYAFEFRDTDGAMYRVVHNTTGSSINYTGTLNSADWGSGSVVVHQAYSPGSFGSSTASPPIPDVPPTAGETYRPAWVSLNGTTSLSAVEAGLATISGGSVTVTVPANSHLVFTQALGVVAGAVYEIEPVCSPGTRLDVTSKGTADGTTVQLYQRTGGLNQQWEAVASGSNFRFEPMHTTNSSMDVLNGGTASDTQVDIHSNVMNSPAQIWTTPLLSSGYVEFYPLCAPSARLDVSGHGTANGTKIQIDNSNLANHYSNEEFQLFRVNPVLGIPPN